MANLAGANPIKFSDLYWNTVNLGHSQLRPLITELNGTQHMFNIFGFSMLAR